MNLGWTETKLNRLLPEAGTEDLVRTIPEPRQSLSVSGLRPIVRAGGEGTGGRKRLTRSRARRQRIPRQDCAIPVVTTGDTSP
jgi:hypothetical protein